MATPMEGVEELGAGRRRSQVVRVPQELIDQAEYRFAALQGEGERLVTILDAIVRSAGISVPYEALLYDNVKLKEFLQFVSGKIQGGQAIQGDPGALAKFQTWNDTMEKLAIAIGIPPRGDQEDVQTFNARLQESLSALLQHRQQQIQTLKAQIAKQAQYISQQEALHNQELTWAKDISEKRVQEMREQTTQYFTSEFERVQTEEIGRAHV